MRAFQDRIDAGMRLADILKRRVTVRPVILGIPRGGVVVSVVVATELDCEHGVVVARKLRAPKQPELAIGAVTASGGFYIDQMLAEMSGADAAYIQEEVARQIAEARRREGAFDGRANPEIAGRTVVVVDDGVATGATAIAAIRAVRAQQAAQVMFAVPVGPPHTIALLRHETDDVICLIVDERFHSVGQYYVNFDPVEDQEVAALLNAHA